MSQQHSKNTDLFMDGFKSDIEKFKVLYVYCIYVYFVLISLLPSSHIILYKHFPDSPTLKS